MDIVLIYRIACLMAALAMLASMGPAYPATGKNSKAKMTDQKISDKIDDEFLSDRAVISAKVDISTSDGIVTLTGEVNNLLAKERAERIAETVKGVRSVINRIQVKPSEHRADAEIQSDVEAALLADPATESYEISTVVTNGMVTLKGTVESYQERALAKLVAKGVRGVTAIEDGIDVVSSAHRGDNEIQHEIEQALSWNVLVDDNLIEINVADGKVSLAGTVGSAAEKRLAMADAWVAGVKSVDASALSVERWSRDDQLRGGKYVQKAAQEVRDAVKQALLMDPRVMSYKVDVDVHGSVVTLRGVVGDLKAKRAAEGDARNTVGVISVDNRLKVRPGEIPPDRQIKDKVADSFLRDPYIERYEISVVVRDGTVYLYGSVDSNLEKNRADDLVSRVDGVVHVVNHLRVSYDTPYLYDPYVDWDYTDPDHLVFYRQRAPFLSDREIKEEINSEMFWSPFIDADKVEVSVDDGIATLRGTVNSWTERRAATENAYEGGATLVDNDLMVSYQ